MLLEGEDEKKLLRISNEEIKSIERDIASLGEEGLEKGGGGGG